MPLAPPAQPGQSFAEIDTPALILDLDAFERNLVTMAAFAEAAGVRLRPHAKTHKSPEIALRQIALADSRQKTRPLLVVINQLTHVAVPRAVRASIGR